MYNTDDSADRYRSDDGCPQGEIHADLMLEDAERAERAEQLARFDALRLATPGYPVS